VTGKQHSPASLTGERVVVGVVAPPPGQFHLRATTQNLASRRNFYSLKAYGTLCPLARFASVMRR
jgi:hypothetical protein